MLNVASVCTPCCLLLDVVASCCAKFETGQTFQPTTPNISLFRDRWSVALEFWIRLHSSSNIVGATHAHYAWFTKTYGLYPSHDALQVPTLLEVVASVCRPLPTRTQHLPTLLCQQCWELLRPFARSLVKTVCRKLWQNHHSKTQKSVDARRSKTSLLNLPKNVVAAKISRSGWFRNRIYHLHKSGLFTEKRPRKPVTGIKDAISPMEHAFPIGTFRPEKQDYLARCFRLVPEIFRRQDPKIMFHVLFYVTTRKIASFEPRC